ncbi:MAG: hypothetical protein Q8941_15770 [Bacteroidota bacterium]|nr:hypothetical protein [Bacteroidota bacterium]
MIAKTRVHILIVFLLLLGQLVAGQTLFISFPDTAKNVSGCKPPKNRELFHDYINQEQKKLLSADGKDDNQYTPTRDEEINLILTRALTNRIDWLQCSIENDSTLTGQNKVRYLRGIENLLKFFNVNTRANNVNPVLLPDIITAYEACMEKDKEGRTIEGIISKLSYEVALSIAKADRITFEKNPGYKPAQDIVVLKYWQLHPEQTFTILRDNPDLPFADSLVRIVAKKYPVQLYNYAQASNRVGAIIRSIKDDIFISTIARMAKSKSGQQYFPFLDNIIKGKLTIEQIDSVESDSVQYYKLLVKTKMDYVERILNKDTAFAYKELTEKMEKRAKDVFVTTINGLHEKPDEVRFKCIQPLSAEELYYLAVLTDGLIYTSSYTKGVYPLMMKKINGRADSLLISLHFDHYRKFISQAAAYNTLGEFLSSFPDQTDADYLMRAFVSRLERTDGLEDGVDVADSYASIVETLKPRAAEMLKNVQLNYERNISENNPKGIAIYNILNKLFLSADSANNIDLTKELGIPPVYNVPFSSLTDSTGEVVIQVFFYGDKDGMMDYTIFQEMFNNANWKIDKSNKQWIVVRSAKGKPVSLYANIPFDEETNEDDNAQKALGAYFEKNKIVPTITINRGHSYHAETTIDYMSPLSRIVFMGSCGGFHLIDAILKKSTDAHIIASKQIGKRDINKPFLQLLTEKLRAGSNIDWIPFWREFKTKADTDGFEDYIPPYKNLGAIFIKAYKKEMGDEENK